MNLVEIAGFLGADAEERFTSGGKRVISLRMATKARSGKEDVTIWWRVNIWGDRFDKMLPYLKKGSALIIMGEMAKPETYVDKEGKTQVSLTLTAEIIKFSPFGKTGKSDEAGGGFSKPQQNSFGGKEPIEEMAFAGGGSDNNFEGDDLPF
jgi:single-strand DNA-binding protein